MAIKGKAEKALDIIKETPRDNWTLKDKVKKLGEEVQELTWDLGKGRKKRPKEELGDVTLLLLMIAEDLYGREVGLDELALMTAKKVRKRKSQS